MHHYKIILHKEPEDGFTVTVPALPGCITCGENIDHAVAMAKEAIGLYLKSLIAHGDPAPKEEEYFEHLVSVSI